MQSKQCILVSLHARSPVKSFGLGLLLIVCSVTCLGVEQRGAIVCKDDLSGSSRKELGRRLQLITGWRELGFDERGSLRIGPTASVGGSATARALLNRALTGNNVIILEGVNNSPDVAFSKVIPARWNSSNPDNRPVSIVLIDFQDFSRLIGDAPARESFNVGWGVLHEVDHVVNDSADASEMGEAGHCEDHINQMRRECHLPERAEYFFTLLPGTERSDFKSRFVRLAFRTEGAEDHKPHRYWLVWDAALVGGLSEAGRVAVLSSRPGQ